MCKFCTGFVDDMTIVSINPFHYNKNFVVSSVYTKKKFYINIICGEKHTKFNVKYCPLCGKRLKDRIGERYESICK